MNNTDKYIQQFREQFLVKGSECTWETYPDPAEIETFLRSVIVELKRETVEDVLKKAKEEQSVMGCIHADKSFKRLDTPYITIERLGKIIKGKKSKSYFDLPDTEKKEILEIAARESNEEQKKVMGRKDGHCVRCGQELWFMIGGFIVCSNENCLNYGLSAFSREAMDREKKYWWKEEK